MTRENKVALVVGFALVLFVGILISDHLSKAQTQRAADLIPADHRGPGDGGRRARLVDLQTDGVSSAATPPRPPAETAVPPAEDMSVRNGVLASSTEGPSQPWTLHGDELGEPADDTTPAEHREAGRSIPMPRPEVAPTTDRNHRVQVGESLSVICHRYYRDVTLIDELADHNGLGNPDEVRAGATLRIPPAQALTGDRPAEPASPSTRVASADADFRTYTIRPGDSLSELAERFLHSAGAWRQLYELNRHVISDPDRIRSGVVIRVPS